MVTDESDPRVWVEVKARDIKIMEADIAPAMALRRPPQISDVRRSVVRR